MKAVRELVQILRVDVKLHGLHAPGTPRHPFCAPLTPLEPFYALLLGGLNPSMHGFNGLDGGALLHSATVTIYS